MFVRSRPARCFGLSAMCVAALAGVSNASPPPGPATETRTETGADGAGAADVRLAREADPEVIFRIALERNPDLREERARVTASRARVRQASRLPDPRLKYEQWGVPLRQPLALGMSDTIMLGVSQTFPALGSRDGQRLIAEADREMAAANELSRRRDLRAQVRRAFADYYRANRQVSLHREHVALTAELVEIARAAYRSGQRAQQDVLRLSLELSRMHSDVAHLAQEEISARALLNALMARPIDAPLGPPAEIALPAPPAAGAASSESADLESRRPEMTVAQAATRRSDAAVEVARAEARWPSLTVGADYWYMPLMPDPHGYGLVLSMSLPWLNPGRRDAIEAAQQAALAERHALESVRTTLRYEIADARAKHRAAEALFAIVDRDLLPQARRNYDAARAGYAAGQSDAIALLDALRSYLDVRLDRVRALVHLEMTAAELERVAGAPVPTPAEEPLARAAEREGEKR